MIVVPVKEGENIERALKRFKRKFEKTGAVRELRGRQAFEKPFVYLCFFQNVFQKYLEKTKGKSTVLPMVFTGDSKIYTMDSKNKKP